MKKNRKAQRDETGSLAIPSGYAMNARPGPRKINIPLNSFRYNLDIHILIYIKREFNHMLWEYIRIINYEKATQGLLEKL